MLNPFGRQVSLRKAISLIVVAFFCTSFIPLSYAQDFDFSDDSVEESTDTFNFTEETPVAPKEPDFVMPSGSKPINLVFFEPVDATEQRHLDSLTDALLEHLSGDLYSEYDSVKAVPILKKLDAMDANTRFECLNGETPQCLTDMAKEVNATNVIVGRIYSDNEARPRISLDLIEVKTNSNKNFVQFETQARLRKQEKDLSPALANLFNKEMPAIDTLLGSGKVDDSNPLPLGQMISGIIIGVVALAAIGVGVKFAIDAKNNDKKVEDAIKSNKEKTAQFGQVPSQLEAKKYADDANKAAMLANVLYASGAVLAVVSVILFLVRPEHNEDLFGSQHDLYLGPSFGSDGAGISAGLRF